MPSEDTPNIVPYFAAAAAIGTFTLMVEQALQGSGRAIDRQRELVAHVQGNSSIRARRRANGGQKWASNQSLTGQFPTHPNREFFTALQGIKSGDQRNFRPDQGNPLSSAILAFCSASKSDRPDRSRTLPRRRTRTPPPRCSVDHPAQKTPRWSRRSRSATCSTRVPSSAATYCPLEVYTMVFRLSLIHI